jgi:hypothetical protein
MLLRTVQAAIAKQCVDAQASVVRDTRMKLEDLAGRQLSQQLTECERLAHDDIGPAMMAVAAECHKQVHFALYFVFILVVRVFNSRVRSKVL